MSRPVDSAVSMTLCSTDPFVCGVSVDIVVEVPLLKECDGGDGGICVKIIRYHDSPGNTNYQ